VLVIGGQGVIGSFIAREFAKAGWEVTRGGRRPEDGADDFRLVDLDRPDTVSAAIADADVVVNTAHHDELVVQRAVLREGGLLIELIELPAAARERLRRETPEPRGLVVGDTGLGGVSYLALAELFEQHPHADSGHYALMFSSNGSTGRAGALFAHGLVTETSHHPTATIPFPDPFGEERCLEIGTGSETVLRADVGGRPVHHYLCMKPGALHGMLRVLNKARLIGMLPKASFTSGTGKVPDEPSSEPICEWAGVARDGEWLGARSVQGEGYYAMTAAATVVYAEALAGREGLPRGLASIDQVVSLAEVQPALERHGMTVRVHGGGPAGGDGAAATNGLPDESRRGVHAKR
jgi:NAD(P)-dependent dehydrogenase (short-subunit alcohol dehydrogenase family)